MGAKPGLGERQSALEYGLSFGCLACFVGLLLEALVLLAQLANDVGPVDFVIVGVVGYVRHMGSP